MKKNLIQVLTKTARSFFLTKTIIFFFLISIASTMKAQVTNTYTYTGGVQSFTVPNCVNALSVNISGAKGGDGLNSSAGSGGWGGNISAIISVTPGQVLNLYVGGAGGNANSGLGGSGGYNGGGAGASYTSVYAGGGGGGASDIRISPYTLADRIIVAGGGGGGGTYTNTGAGFERGGSGGTATGENGYSNNSNSNGSGGAGGGNSAGGSGGFMSVFCTAQSGSFGLGGAANTCSNGGGGGGGGYYGGGGGMSSGGGGGSSYAVFTSSTVVHSLGANPGNGAISISYIQSPPTINIAASSTNVCSGSAVSFTASGGVNYTWTTIPASQTITGQNIISNTFTTAGAYAVNVVGSNTITGCTSSTMGVVIVNAGPSLVANASKTVNCPGNSTTLSAIGANLYQWDTNANNVTTATTVVNPTILTQYVVSGTLTSTGCTATASVTVHIYNPIVTVTGNTAVCSSGSCVLSASVINPASGALNTYTWNTGPTTGPTIQVAPSVTTVYTVSAKSYTNGNVTCLGTQTVKVLVHSNPTVTVKFGTIGPYICRFQVFTLVAEGALTYTWNNGAFMTTTVTVVQNQIGTVAYTVVGTAANGCVGDTVFYVKVTECMGMEEYDQGYGGLHIFPNPNNGQFNIVGERDSKLKLINGLGQTVREFELNAYTEYKVQAADLPKGIYFISASDNQVVTRQKIIVR